MLIATTKGDIEESMLVTKIGSTEDENERTAWIEHYSGDELVHRSVSVEIKRPLIVSLTGSL